MLAGSSIKEHASRTHASISCIINHPSITSDTALSIPERSVGTKALAMDVVPNKVIVATYVADTLIAVVICARRALIGGGKAHIINPT